MKIIILGASQIAYGLTEYLINENNDITIVDPDIEKLKEIQNRHDIKIVKGAVSYPNTLRDADADNADLIVAVTESDETNMIACQLAYSLFNIPQKIARIRNRDYIAERDFIFNNKAIPIDNIIAPEHLITEEIANIIKCPGTNQIVEFSRGKISIASVTAYYGGECVGANISQFYKLTLAIPAKILCIYRSGISIQINENTTIEAGDEIFFISATPHVRSIMGYFQKIEPPYRKIMIIGGGNIGKGLAHILSNKYSIKLVETNTKVSVALADEFDKTNVEIYCCDPSNQDFLQEEHIDKMDLVVSVTESDETNIMSALLAKNLGAKHSIVLIQKYSYINLLQNNAIDIVVFPQEATISSLLSSIRRNGISNVRIFKRGKIECIEIKIIGDKEHSNIIGKKISDIVLPQNVKIGAICRDNDICINSDKIEIKNNDLIIFFITDTKSISEIIKLTSPTASFFNKMNGL
ncbi:MAG: Trk system potassium transporter TrkA [Succinivibrionaceae bacterium]